MNLRAGSSHLREAAAPLRAEPVPRMWNRMLKYMCVCCVLSLFVAYYVVVFVLSLCLECSSTCTGIRADTNVRAHVIETAQLATLAGDQAFNACACNHAHNMPTMSHKT